MKTLMRIAVTLLLLIVASTSISASPITILSVTGGTPGVAPGLFSDQTLAISFTVGKSYSDVSFNPFISGAFVGTAYLTTQIGAGTTVADEVASSPFTSIYPAPCCQTVLQGVSIGPGTYFLVLSTTSDIPPQGWATSIDPVTVADVGASTPFGMYISSTTGNIYAPSDIFSFFTSINGSVTTPEFIITGATNVAVPEPASLTLLASGLLGFGMIRRRRKVW